MAGCFLVGQCDGVPGIVPFVCGGSDPSGALTQPSIVYPCNCAVGVQSLGGGPTSPSGSPLGSSNALNIANVDLHLGPAGACDGVQCAATGNDCTQSQCAFGGSCVASNRADGTVCSGGVCSLGVCSQHCDGPCVDDDVAGLTHTLSTARFADGSCAAAGGATCNSVASCAAALGLLFDAAAGELLRVELSVRGAYLRGNVGDPSAFYAGADLSPAAQSSLVIARSALQCASERVVNDCDAFSRAVDDARSALGALRSIATEHSLADFGVASVQRAAAGSWFSTLLFEDSLGTQQLDEPPQFNDVVVRFVEVRGLSSGGIVVAGLVETLVDSRDGAYFDHALALAFDHVPDDSPNVRAVDAAAATAALGTDAHVAVTAQLFAGYAGAALDEPTVWAAARPFAQDVVLHESTIVARARDEAARVIYSFAPGTTLLSADDSVLVYLRVGASVPFDVVPVRTSADGASVLNADDALFTARFDGRHYPAALRLSRVAYYRPIAAQPLGSVVTLASAYPLFESLRAWYDAPTTAQQPASIDGWALAATTVDDTLLAPARLRCSDALARHVRQLEGVAAADQHRHVRAIAVAPCLTRTVDGWLRTPVQQWPRVGAQSLGDLALHAFEGARATVATVLLGKHDRKTSNGAREASTGYDALLMLAKEYGRAQLQIASGARLTDHAESALLDASDVLQQQTAATHSVDQTRALTETLHTFNANAERALPVCNATRRDDPAASSSGNAMMSVARFTLGKRS